MTDDPDRDGAVRPGRSAAVLFLACAGALLGGCGGGDRSTADAPAAAPPAFLSQAVNPAALPAGGTPSARGIVGQATVVLNPQPASAPVPAAAPAAPEAQRADPATIVGVAKDSHGNVLLQQRDGAIREVTADGKVALQAGSEPVAGELPPTLIVAVDATNTVHMVDSDACRSRTIAPDGRVTTTALPPARADQPCLPGARMR
jgi:hypothetical protein